MNNPSKKLQFIWLGLLALLSLFIGGRWNFPLAAWLAPIFALRFFRTTDKGLRGFLWLWLAMSVPLVISWHGATMMSHLHPLAEPLSFILLVPLSLLPNLLDRLYFRRFQQQGASPFWMSLVYPVSAAAVDFFSSSGSPVGTFGAAAYSQAGFLPMMQLASIAGLWGIPFLLAWFGSTLNYAWERSFQWQRIRSGVLTTTGVLLLALGFGFGRLLFPAPVAAAVQAAGFSLPQGEFGALMAQVSSGDETGFQQAARRLHSQQLVQVRQLADDGAQIIVLQEGAGVGYSGDVQELIRQASAAAREKGIYIVLPTLELDPLGEKQPHNAVSIIDPSGKVILQHTKFGGTQVEGTQTGSGELQVVDTPYGRLSAVICWDADFPDVIRQVGAQNVDLLFVPANDWREVRDIHADMSLFRAVENGVPVFRQTGAGVSLVSDAYGRTLSRVDTFESPDTEGFTGMQMTLTPSGSVPTAYPQVGNSFGLLMLVGLLIWVAVLILSRFRRQ